MAEALQARSSCPISNLKPLLYWTLIALCVRLAQRLHSMLKIMFVSLAYYNMQIAGLICCINVQMVPKVAGDEKTKVF